MSVSIPVLITGTAATTGATSTTVAVPESGQSTKYKGMDVYVNVTAATGGTAPTVIAEVQWSPDGTTWYSTDTTKDITAGQIVGGGAVKEVDVKGSYFRVVTTFGGAPTNMTYTVGYRFTS